MKQKEIVINGKLSLDAEQLIEEYFAVKRENGIEGFIFSEDVFYLSYYKTYELEELRSAQYYAVYTVDKCEICWKPFDVIIRDREHLYDYIQVPHKKCHSCKGFHHIVGTFLSADISHK